MSKSQEKPSEKNDKQNIFVRFWNWGWGIYHKNEEVWSYLISGGIRICSNCSYIQNCKNFRSFNYT